MQDIALDNKTIALYLKIRAITKEIIARKQVTTTRKSLVAQKLQLQNITINNIRTFASITSINSIASTSARTLFLNVMFKFNALVAIFSSVSRRYLNDIFYNKLDIKNVIRFTIDFFLNATTNAINSFDARSLLNLLRIFDIYIFIALSFVSYLTIR